MELNSAYTDASMMELYDKVDDTALARLICNSNDDDVSPHKQLLERSVFFGDFNTK